MFTAHEPHGVPYSEIALGGPDPSALPGRSYGAESSGILGRAFFDALNANRVDRNTATSPALGVFTGELFLFEAETHSRLAPTYVTSFGYRFMKLVPEMGGTPVGAGSLDSIVTAEDFDLNNSNQGELQRYFDIFLAADDWATAAGVILAHEVGHTVGLVIEGPPPRGLHGDISLHNEMPALGDVMSSAVGYDSLISLAFRFRDLNAAYLTHRVLLK